MGFQRSKGRRIFRTTLFVVVGVLFVIVLLDSMGVFRDSPYTAIPHGDHVHYVPNDCEDFRINQFPTREPGPDERITCEGRVVPAENVE